MQHPREVVDMFNEFKSAQTNLLNVKEFLELLQESGMDRSCQLLYKKLHKKRNENLNLNQFAESFHYDSSDFDNFEMLFQIMDTSNSKKISKQELKKQCDILGMGFSDKDIDIMINQIGSEEQDVVSRDKLWSVLQQYKSHEIHHQ
ncbi:unnamed protein product (macronuclear) [Paramecium tetraurelia]|uniref:EF-hand domain-containing protein n=1 Tax=Paramecium tetraurelia TaxID=5888 RepID=A0C5W2_PARTE|nr:uncharacterized protein GSPATT00035308001 [Paramecium tetraurelia]CAK66179.1 unnamed protein product [Paramecium tetraurelia]|eukprot:XP_001433576.1 hypothetical protein (macronuclear) [Paramecium tetraurelia strain d4-2]